MKIKEPPSNPPNKKKRIKINSEKNIQKLNFNPGDFAHGCKFPVVNVDSFKERLPPPPPSTF